MIPKSLAIQMMPYIVSRDHHKPRSVLAKSIIKYRLSTRRLGPFPSFIIIGAQRGGTTRLYDLLLEHPMIYPCLVKEVQYFDMYFGNGTAWYQANFAPGLDGSRRQISGEATPNYLFHPYAPRRIFDATPDTKLIVLLRNPVDRAFSHYNLMRVQGTENLTFEEALDREAERVRVDSSRLLSDENYDGRDRMRYSYVAKGIYADQLSGWLDLFPPDRLLILQSEAMYRDTATVLGKVTAFLDLPPFVPTSAGTQRKFGPPLVTLRGEHKPSMSQPTRDFLREFYRPHNERLFELIGEDYGWND